MRPACMLDAVHIAERMREADRREVMASHGLSPLAAACSSVQASLDPMAALVDGEVMAIFGVAENGNVATPWLLGADGVEQYHFAFLRLSRGWIKDMRSRYALMRNWVDARNEVSIRWLRWLGFEIQKPEPYGIEGRPFHPFEMR